ncbi:hypothetical protein GTA08_BOTSDO12653 [Botryosphaeria dothidea]|uniref:Protein kinase domain-containing protein n=1 Tax=Botryosphaeria dothidea TaxID=55169 RepID=A0A8H4J2Z3_9PEZI|nr:hypothetical protein GTA08_BOTSDO12653 [Botryosphaeria dothidea]
MFLGYLLQTIFLKFPLVSLSARHKSTSRLNSDSFPSSFPLVPAPPPKLLFLASSATPVAASSLTPTPLSAPYRQGGYDIYPAKAGGTYGTVSYGINTSTGDSVAVKRIRRTAKNFGVIENEIEILQLLRHPNICYLENVHYPSGKRSPTSFQPGECDEIILFTRPVAQTTLFNYIGAPLEAAHFKPILQQSLSALAHLHSQNIMRRDIKPGNMTITIYQSIKVCIIDVGSGLIGTTSIDHMVGTIHTWLRRS